MSRHIAQALYDRKTSWALITMWCAKHHIHPDDLGEERLFDSMMRLSEKIAFIVSFSALPGLYYLLNKKPVPEGLVSTLVASACAWIFARLMLYNSTPTPIWKEHLDDVSDLEVLMPGCVRMNINVLCIAKDELLDMIKKEGVPNDQTPDDVRQTLLAFSLINTDTSINSCPFDTISEEDVVVDV